MNKNELKFKRVNVVKLADQLDVNYSSLDLIRQTAIETVINIANNQGINKDELIKIMLTNAEYLLNLMIEEGDTKK